MLLGWDDPGRKQVVVATLLGPGPRAEHNRATFRPDGTWQQAQLDQIYPRTDGKLTFLGDWHVHPAGGLGISRRDRKTMALVALSRDARCPHPILLAASTDGSFRTGAWTWSPRRWPRLYGDAVRLDLSVWEPAAAERFWDPH